MKRRAAAFIRWVVLIAVIGGAGAIGSQVVYALVRPKVTVTHPVDAPVVQAFYATGTLMAEREYEIKSNAPGYISQVLVDKGDRLTKDQPLAVVIEDSVQHKFDQAKAERDQKVKLADEKTSPLLQEYDARITAFTDILDLARREQKRLTDLIEKNAASQVDLDRAIERTKTFWADVEQLKAQKATKKIDLQKDLEVAEAALKIAKWNLDRQTIRCPIENAVVLDRPVTVGTRLAVNDHIMWVADVRPEKLIMRAAVDEEDKVYVKEGQMVRMTLYAYAGRAFSGKVKKVYDKADADRRTFEVDVEMVEKEPTFSAGMTGELAFVMAEKASAWVIPSQAVQSGIVWTVKDGVLSRPQVKLGLKSIERVEVVSGLSAQDDVVISPLDSPVDGKRVRTQSMDPTAAANLNKPKVEKAFQNFN
ncbi:MAG TPA: efflux RND transporter periplasmic adaptor subunit [Tepidisphaeraceae bacterium]|nr:efflux RND transporter periplasmic adaptor subunit [Tepidisphaeraceae bacterium]